MQTVKTKFKNIRNEHLRSIYKNTNFILPLKQPKHLYRELTSPRFISSFKNIRKPVPYKCNDKRCKLCPNYLNKTNKFTMTNVQKLENPQRNSLPLSQCHPLFEM